MAIRLFNSVKLYNINKSPRKILAFGVPFFRNNICNPIVKQPRIPKLEIITAIKLSMGMFNAIVFNDAQLPAKRSSANRTKIIKVDDNEV